MDQATIDTYNQLAKEYDDETTGFWDKFPRTILDRFVESVKGKKVLDIGSGPGRDGLILQDYGMNVTCLDASKVMVDLCAKQGLNAVAADFSKLPFEDVSFDGAWAYTALLHVSKQEIDQCLQEIRRVLRSGGILGLGMIAGDTEGYRDNMGEGCLRWFSYYTEQELRDLLQKNGFEVTYFETFKPGKRDYLNFVARKIKSTTMS